jgi:phosphoserine phosphatase
MASPTAPDSRTEFVVTIFLSYGKDDDRYGSAIIRFNEIVRKIAGAFNESPNPLQVLDDRVYERGLRFEEPVSLEKLRKHPLIIPFEKEHNLQVAFQERNVFRKHKRLAVFDMDSTLIQQEVIDEIARKLGVEDKVSAITERAMNGELDFTESLRERCALLRGVPSSVFEELRNVITLSPGAADLVKALKKLGYKTAVLSGGFTPLASWLAGQLGLDYSFANHLTVSKDGKTLTGELSGEIVNAEKKRELVLEIASTEKIALDQVLVVGDGANDLAMMKVAGLGIAFNAKARVQELAPVKLNSDTMLDMLHLLGLSKSEIYELLA